MIKFFCTNLKPEPEYSDSFLFIVSYRLVVKATKFGYTEPTSKLGLTQCVLPTSTYTLTKEDSSSMQLTQSQSSLHTRYLPRFHHH